MGIFKKSNLQGSSLPSAILEYIIIVAFLALSGFTLAGPSNISTGPTLRFIADAELSPLPKEAYPALRLSELRKQNIFIKIPARARPELFERVSRSRYQSLSWKVIRTIDDAPLDARTCWNVVISGGLRCFKNIYELSKIDPPHLKKTAGEIDLLEYSRWAKKTYGMRIARDLLYYRMKRIDSSGGELEARVLKTTKDPSHIFSDALINLSPARKKRIGFFVIYGLDVNNGDSPARALIRQAASKAHDYGFYTKIFNTQPFASSDANAKLIGAQLVEEARVVDEIIVLAVSKGVADLIKTLVVKKDEVLRDFPAEKLKLVVSLVGTVRESYIARWILSSSSPTPFVLKTFLKSKSGDVLEGIKSLATGPWENHKAHELEVFYPNLKWLSVSMLPEGADGHLSLSFKADFIRESVTSSDDDISPGDGLVESAATLLPPASGVPQYIVRGFGPHTLALGRYFDGTLISKLQNGQGPIIPEAGAEILDAYLRAMPQSMLNDRER